MEWYTFDENFGDEVEVMKNTAVMGKTAKARL